MLRKLEIGPGKRHLKGYDTIGMEYANIKWDVTKPLPFDSIYDEVLASHVIEHIEWHRTQSVISNWAKVIKPGGRLVIWTPDVDAVIDVLLRAERGEDITPSEVDSHAKMMRQLNPKNNPYIWANYRIFAAENPKAAIQFHRPHRSMFTFKHLKGQMESAGLKDVQKLMCKPPYDHGWANMGVVGIKGEQK
jgi:predicted SAM-dependent methyltransferase